MTTVALPIKRRRARMPRPFWERGYRSHGYWRGKEKLGGVTIERGTSPERKYRWQAGTHAGHAATLRDAKRAVESVVLFGMRQLPLFDEQ